MQATKQADPEKFFPTLGANENVTGQGVAMVRRFIIAFAGTNEVGGIPGHVIQGRQYFR